MKKFVGEMGGKDPLLVMEDADLDLAANLAVEIGLMNAGQICTSIERVYVAERVRERFEELVLAKAEAYSMREAKQPLVSAVQRDLVQSQVDDAIKQGAMLRMGGTATAFALTCSASAWLVAFSGSIPTGPGFFYPVNSYSH